MLRYLLPLTAAAAMCAFWPAWEGGGLSPRWMALAVLSGLCVIVTVIRESPIHTVGLWFLIWSWITLAWTPSLAFGMGDMMHLLILAGIFLAAAELEDATASYLTLIAGVSVSTLAALTQVKGMRLVPELVGPSGLFVNKNYLSEIAAVALVIAMARRWWWLAPGPAAALLLSHSRAALIAVGVAGLAWLWQRSRMACGALAGLGVACFVWSTDIPSTVSLDGQTEQHDASSFYHRLGVWGPTLKNLQWLGYGEGSFYSVYPTFQPHPPLALTRPERAHNEVIDVACELGLPGLLLFLVFWGRCYRAAETAERYGLLCLAVISCFSFPLHLPATGFAAAFMAGRCARRSRALRKPAWNSRAVRDPGLQSA